MNVSPAASVAICLWLVGALGADASQAARTPTGAIVREEIRTIRTGLAPLIRAAQERFAIPGLSLILVRGTQTLWAEGFGLADVANKTPATPATIYRAGSLAKPFTAIAVMQLAEAGEVDIDQPLSAYLPAFSIRSRFDTTAEPITVRSILCHHSGLPTDLNKGMWTNRSFTEVAAKLAEEYTAFPPNLVFSYSNIGYTLLGHLVEKISGMPYAGFITERIFQPLGMLDTGLGPSPGAQALRSKGYKDGKAVDLLPIRDLPALGLSTTASDLGRFMRALLNPRRGAGGRTLLMAETLEEMFEPQNLHVDLDFNVVNGLGWFLEHESIPGAHAVIRHGGTTLAFSAELIMLPEGGLGVAVMANADGSRHVVAKLAEEILASVLATGVKPRPAALLIADIERDRAKHEPVDMSGDYATDFGLLSIRAKDAKVCACMVEETFDLIPYPNGWFGIGESASRSLPSAVRPLAQMRFQTQEIDGREVVVVKTGAKEVVVGEKVPPSPIPKVWLDRVGRYELLNPDEDFPLTEPQLKVRAEHLCMSYKLPRLSPKTIQVPLQPISETEAIILGLGRTRGETLRAVIVNGEERLRYSGFEGRKIRRGEIDNNVHPD